MRLHNGHVLGAAAFLAVPVAVVAPLGLSSLLIAGAIGAGLLRYVRDRARPAPPPLITCLLVLTVLAAALSLLWAESPGAGAAKLAVLATITLAGLIAVDCGLALSIAERGAFARLLIVGVAFGLLLLLIERLGGAPIRELQRADWVDGRQVTLSFNRAATVIAILIWPAALAAGRLLWPLGAILWTIGVVAILLLASGAAKLAVLLGLTILAASWALPGAISRALAVVLAGLVLAAPLLPRVLPPPDQLKAHADLVSRSGYHRLLIWDFTARRIDERPVLGWGFDSARRIPGGEMTLDDSEPALPLHPHNSALQWWLELGAIGGLLGAALIAAISLRLARLGRPFDRAIGAATLVSALTVSSLSYGAWQSWWLGALWLGAAALVALPRGARQ